MGMNIEDGSCGKGLGVITSLMRRAARLSQDMSLGISEYLIFVHGCDSSTALGPAVDMGSPSSLQQGTPHIVMREYRVER